MTTTFANARKALDDFRASEADYQLVDHLANHGEQEGELLARYEALAADSASPAVKYLVNLIMEDERRHHRVLVEMANSVAWNLNQDNPLPAVPRLSAGRTVEGELAEATRQLLDAERQDQAELKRLRKELRPMADTTLWGLLVDLMLLDTDKHIRILRFLADHA